MPIISNFSGMTVKMYYLSKEHNPPHIHFIYGEYIASIDIVNLEVLEGDLPKKKLKKAMEWISIHKEEIMEMWETQQFKKIKPLE